MGAGGAMKPGVIICSLLCSSGSPVVGWPIISCLKFLSVLYLLYTVRSARAVVTGPFAALLHCSVTFLILVPRLLFVGFTKSGTVVKFRGWRTNGDPACCEREAITANETMIIFPAHLPELFSEDNHESDHSLLRES